MKNKRDLNKQQVIEAITLSLKPDLTLVKTEEVLNAFHNLIISTVSAGGNVKIKGFGTFTSKKCKKRNGRNPLTGESIKIPASRRVKFIAGSRFIEAVKR